MAATLRATAVGLATAERTRIEAADDPSTIDGGEVAGRPDDVRRSRFAVEDDQAIVTPDRRAEIDVVIAVVANHRERRRGGATGDAS